MRSQIQEQLVIRIRKLSRAAGEKWYGIGYCPRKTEPVSKKERRRDHNRLGFAVQLCLLRYPGWPLGPTEDPPQNLLKFVAEQLGTDPAEVAEYSRRPQTRTDHAQELARLYRFRHYASPFPALLRAHLRAKAVGNEAAYTLMEVAFEWLRSQRVIVPAPTTLESLVRSVRNEIKRHIYDRIEEELTGEQKKTY